MISNVNFTGRETLLTGGVGVAAKAVDTVHEYLGAGAMLPRMEDTFVKNVKVVKETVAKEVAKAASAKAENAELSYAISHGQPKSELVEFFGKDAGKQIDYKA